MVSFLFLQGLPNTMLACIPHTMSRKRRGIPFATSGQYDVPATKRSRKDDATSHSKGIGMDLVVLSRPSRSSRLASVKAQIAVRSLLSAENHRSRSSSPHEYNTGQDEETLIVESSWPVSLSNHAERPHGFNEKIRFGRENQKEDQVDSCNSSPSPLSSLGSECDEEKVMDFHSRALPPKIKSSFLNLVPVAECSTASPTPKAKKSQLPAKLNGYVRRMASLNARARVSAMMEPMRRPSKQKVLPPTSSESTAVSAKSPVCSPCHSLSSSRRVSPRRSPVPQHGVVTRSRQNSAEKEIVDTNPSSSRRYVLVCGSPMTLKECGIIQGEISEAPTFNSEGLLWNGDTLHPQSRVYLSPDGTVPHLIVPPVCPARPSRVQETKSLAKTRHQKKQAAVKVYIQCIYKYTCMYYID